MTSRERLLTALRGGTPDRVPVAPFGLGHLDPNGPTCVELIAETDPFIDVGAGDPLLGPDLPITTERHGDVTTSVLHTPRGDLVSRYRQTELASATVEFYCKGPEDVRKLLSLPYTPPEPRLDGYREWRDRVGEEALVMVGIPNAVCLAANVLSPEDFSLLWADAPDLMAEMTTVAAERVVRWVDALCRAGVDAFRIVGGEYVTCQLGPRAFDALIAPHDTRLCEALRRHGAVAYYHCHGRIMRWLEPLADLGIHALDPLEAPPWGDCDLAEARRRIGDRVCLVGNLDDMEVLDQRPVEEVVALGLERARQAGGTGFVLGGTASGTYGERGARAFIALARAVRSLRA